MLSTYNGNQKRLCHGSIIMNFTERALTFLCENHRLYGVLSLPDQGAGRGVLIAVGGPQYRVGSHRQFVLLARELAMNGIPVLRFDFRGMGDSEGITRTFEDVQDDLRSAIDKFITEIPLLSEVVILGLCDAASAALFYAYQDTRVTGLVLLNPWVRTSEGAARVHLKYYYKDRLLKREFWDRIWQGKFSYVAAAQSLFQNLRAALPVKQQNAVFSNKEASLPRCSTPLPERMFYGLKSFRGRVLLIISGKDLTAREFLNVVEGSREWRNLLASSLISRRDLPEANHTFSRKEWRNKVADWTKEWIFSW